MARRGCVSVALTGLAGPPRTRGPLAIAHDGHQ